MVKSGATESLVQIRIVQGSSISGSISCFLLLIVVCYWFNLWRNYLTTVTALSLAFLIPAWWAQWWLERFLAEILDATTYDPEVTHMIRRRHGVITHVSVCVSIRKLLCNQCQLVWSLSHQSNSLCCPHGWSCRTNVLQLFLPLCLYILYVCICEVINCFSVTSDFLVFW